MDTFYSSGMNSVITHGISENLAVLNKSAMRIHEKLKSANEKQYDESPYSENWMDGRIRPCDAPWFTLNGNSDSMGHTTPRDVLLVEIVM